MVDRSLRLLGQTEVIVGGRPLAPQSGRGCTLLALLALETGRVVSADHLVDQLWTGELPRSGTATLHVYVSRLRKLLRGAGVGLTTRAPGYRLDLPRDAIDVHVLADRVSAAEQSAAADDWAEVLARASSAAGLWGGEPFTDATPCPDLEAEAARLRALRDRADELTVRALLALDRPQEAEVPAMALTRRDPLNEAYWRLRIKAVHADGRAADALLAYEEYQTRLADELGLDPSPAMTALHLEVLRAGQPPHSPDGSVGTPASQPSALAGSRSRQARPGSAGVPTDPPSEPAGSRSRQARPGSAGVPIDPPSEPAGSRSRQARPGSAGVPTEPPPAAPERPGPLVTARVAEQAVIDRAIAGARSGSGRVVSLEGEPGIGKTLLAEYAAARARTDGLTVVWTRAVDGPGTPALWIWEQVLSALPDDDASPVETGAAQLRTLVSGSEAAEAVDPVRARFRLSEQLADRVVTASRRRPALLVVDDLQWADDGTMQALRLLGPLVRSHAFCLVLTSRPTGPSSELATTLALLGRDESTDRIQLQRFSTADVAAYLADHGSSPGAMEGTDPAALRERSGGNPLFLAELVRGGLLDTARVPATVSGLVRQRLAALPPTAVELLEVAAVAGRRLDPEVLARAVGRSAPELRSGLRPVLAEGVVTADRGARSWSFSHDLVRDAIVEDIDPVRQAELHHRLAGALSEVYADELDDHVDRLAHHRYEAAAGSTSREAYLACMRAADVAVRRLAYDQAAVQRTRALASLPPGESTRAERYEALMQLTGERRLAGDVVGASASLRSAIELARRLGDRSRLVRAVSVLGGVTLWNWRQFGDVDAETIRLLRELLGEPSKGERLPLDPPPLTPRQRAELAGTLAVELYYDDHPDGGEQAAAEAVRLAREIGDPVLLGRALNNQVIALWRPGRDAERHAALDEALSWVGRGLPEATEVIARLHRGPLALRAGDLLAFEADLDRAAEITPRLGVFEIEGQVTAQQVGRALIRGEHELAIELVERCYAELRRTNLWAPEYTRLIQDTTLCRMRGQVGEVADRLVARAFEDVHRSLRWTAVLVLAHAGDIRQARALQVRWGLQRLDRRTHWASTFEWAQAAEVALLLGTPAPAEVSAVLDTVDAELVVAGTALAVWGPVAHLRSVLAEVTGDRAAATRHARDAARTIALVTQQLGRPPTWCYPVDGPP